MRSTDSVQVNIPAESGDMGILANHVPSIEQLKPGLVEIIEESGGSKQFFCMLGFSLLSLETAAFAQHLDVHWQMANSARGDAGL